MYHRFISYDLSIPFKNPYFFVPLFIYPPIFGCYYSTGVAELCTVLHLCKAFPTTGVIETYKKVQKKGNGYEKFHTNRPQRPGTL